MTRTLVIAATVATIVTSMINVALTPKHPTGLPRGFTKPVLASELVKDAGEIGTVYGTAQDPWHSGFIGQLRLNTWSDFAFILSYGLTYFLLGRLLRGKLGGLISILAWTAALADIIEDIGIFRITYAEHPTDALAAATRYPSLVKWAILSIIWMGLLRLFVSPGPFGGWRIVELLTGITYAAAGVVCLVGVLDGNNRIELAVLLVGLATLLQLVVFWRDFDFPRQLTSSNRRSQ